MTERGDRIKNGHSSDVVDTEGVTNGGDRSTDVYTSKVDPSTRVTPNARVTDNMEKAKVHRAFPVISSVINKVPLHSQVRLRLCNLRASSSIDTGSWSKAQRKAWSAIGKNSNDYFMRFTAPDILNPVEANYNWSADEDTDLLHCYDDFRDLKDKGLWGLFAFHHCPRFTGKQIYERWYTLRKKHREVAAAALSLKNVEADKNDKAFIKSKHPALVSMFLLLSLP